MAVGRNPTVIQSLKSNSTGLHGNAVTDCGPRFHKSRHVIYSGAMPPGIYVILEKMRAELAKR